MRCAILGLWGNGYRTSSSQPGHHQLALQCLPLTMKVKQDVVNVLDSLRRQRNATDYDGVPVSEAMLAACIDAARRLLEHTERWVGENRPEWGTRP